MKLVIQIPCLNEEKTLPAVVRDLPERVAGFDEVEVLVVDDGSTDGTAEAARRLGVQHIARLPGNKGLARAFSAGLEVSTRLGADVIVNTDGDHQYRGADIEKLVRPILKGTADIVIGDRDPKSLVEFSWLKRRLQALGSFIVRRFSGTDVPDATSGFRAFSREAALHMNILSPFSYTLESIIQGARKGLRIASVRVGTNPSTRQSRLMRSNWEYVFRSAMTILRISIFYKPFWFFSRLAMVAFLLGTVLGMRYVYLFLTIGGRGHVQSLILAAVLLLIGFSTFVLAVIGNLVSVNRRLQEEVLYRLRRMELPSTPEIKGITVESYADSESVKRGK